MDFSGGSLFLSLAIGAVGAGFFIYGKKQARLPQLCAGVLIALDSGIVSSTLWMCVGAAAVLGALWVVLRAGW
jgi:hypothetical protein